MKSHLHDTVTIPSLAAASAMDYIQWEGKKTKHQGYVKNKRITDAITHTATTCAWTPIAATAINVLMHMACLLTFPAKESASLYFCSPDSSLQVVICSTCLAAEGQLSLKAGSHGSEGSSTCGQSILTSTSREVCLAGFPGFAINPGLMLTQNGAVPLS